MWTRRRLDLMAMSLSVLLSLALAAEAFVPNAVTAVAGATRCASGLAMPGTGRGTCAAELGLPPVDAAADPPGGPTPCEHSFLAPCVENGGRGPLD